MKKLIIKVKRFKGLTLFLIYAIIKCKEKEGYCELLSNN